MQIPLAFLRRDLLIWSSYHLAVVWQLLGVLVFVGLFYFLGQTMGNEGAMLGGQPGGFVAFALSGIAFTDVLAQGLYSLPQAIRENQKAGTLEPMLLTPISAMTLALSSALFSIALAAGRMTAYLLLGALVLGFWHDVNMLTIVAVFIPALFTFIGTGLVSASFIILVKQGEPVLVAYSALTALLGGVFFPVSALPEWMQSLAVVAPLTHALTGLRAGLEGASLAAVAGPALALWVMAAVLVPVGWLAFTWAINHARHTGALAQY